MQEAKMKYPKLYTVIQVQTHVDVMFQSILAYLVHAY
jgi:hypothetical protein